MISTQVDDDLTFIEATDLPELMKTATVVDAARPNGHLLDSVHVPQHEWDFLTPAALDQTERNLLAVASLLTYLKVLNAFLGFHNGRDKAARAVQYT